MTTALAPVDQAAAPAPAPDLSTRLRTALSAYLTEPDTYWRLLVALLVASAENLAAAHAGCGRPGCPTCAGIADLLAVVAADDTTQPSGCACADHRHYPRPA
jgi:hypothetical protein